MNKKYLIFGYDYYDACGGMNDFLFFTDTIDSAIKKIKIHYESNNSFQYYQIYDIEKEQLEEIKMP